ncbi:MAG: formate dehydrogenase subunit delta [Gammaproteobacteria bacterium]|nr:formate dehydrogenase subunit delta [Gammaproteobacteria bacterium]
MPPESDEHLVKMVNQIVTSVPGDTAAAKTANAAVHLEKFWSPLMKQQIGDYVAAGGAGLHPEAVEAVARMAK